MDSEDDFDKFNQARGRLLPNKLPADLDLMVHGELWTWIKEETLKEHWVKGRDKKCVKFGHTDFEPSFWLGEIWAWSNVYIHPNNLPKAAYTGPGNMTEYLKKVVKNRLEQLGMNHIEWVKDTFTEIDRKKRERTRNKSTPSEVERPGLEDDVQDEGNDSLNEGDIEDEENVLNATFAQEAALDTEAGNNGNNKTNQSSVNISNISEVLRNNGINLSNLSSVGADSFATSTMQRPNITRRFSECQAEKLRKQTERMESVSENSDASTGSFRKVVNVPTPLSPAFDDARTSPTRPGPSQPSPPPLPGASRSPPRAPRANFTPRRKPIGDGGCVIFGSWLNVGKNLSNSVTDIHLSLSLVIYPRLTQLMV